MPARGTAYALIPARGGSRGIPLKNLARINGKSLLEYAVDAARKSNAVGRIIVSSDSDAILDAARGLGAEPLRRPAQFATDLATSDSVVAHCIAALDLARDCDAPIVFLQPTSPLRTGEHVAAAITTWQSTGANCVVSVYEPSHHPAKCFRLDESGMLVGLCGPDAPFTPRQSLPRAFMPNGAIYVFSAAAFMAQGRIPRDGLAPFVMDWRASIDIDTLADLSQAEQLLRGE